MVIDLYVLMAFAACSGMLYGAYLGFRDRAKTRQNALKAQYDQLLKLMVSMKSQLKNIEKSIEAGDFHG